jgi:hypothetical protein
LDHEILDHAMEYDAIVEGLVSKSDEILDGVRCISVISLESYGALIGLDRHKM